MTFEPSEYSHVHRMFLQSCAYHGTMEVNIAVALLTRILKKCNDEIEGVQFEGRDPDSKVLKEIVSAINEKIGRFDQKLDFVRYEVDNVEYLVFTYKSEISMNKFQTAYTDQEVQYFRILVKEIAESNDLHIRQMSCVNLTSHIPKLKANMKVLQKTRAEELLTEWTRTGYFLLSDNEIYFGPRMLSEFGNFLRTNFPDNIVACQLCKNVVFAGIRCSKCSLLLHEKCIKKSLAKSITKCPGCKHKWKVPMSE